MQEEPGRTDGLRIERTVFPETETLVSIQTIPGAVCFLYHNKADRRLQLDADDRGIVRFHIRASKNAQPIEFSLEYPGEGEARIVHTLAFSSDLHSLPDVETAAGNAAPSGGRQLRPPLEGDPLALSNQELVTRGYSPRPNPVTAPARYARWHRLVSQPFAVANPRKVSHPEVSFQQRELPPKLLDSTLPLPPPVGRAMFNSNSNIWSGARYTNPTGQFYQIQADWIVPDVFPGPPSSVPYSAVAEWIGLDSSSSNTDLYQAGTDSECILVPTPYGNWTVTNYWMWIEMLPFAPWAVPDFPISPGDTVSVDIFVADQNGTTRFNNGSGGGLTAANNSVWFLLYNTTQKLVYAGTEPTSPETAGGQSSTGFTGNSAEFILERPSFSVTGPVPLANFGAVTMHGCCFYDSMYGDDWPFQLSAEGSQSLDGSLSYLNMVNTWNNDLLAVPLSLPDPTSPGGYSILWIWANWQ